LEVEKVKTCELYYQKTWNCKLLCSLYLLYVLRTCQTYVLTGTLNIQGHKGKKGNRRKLLILPTNFMNFCCVVQWLMKNISDSCWMPEREG